MKTQARTPIHAACERDGFYVVSHGTTHPVDVIAAMVRALAVLDVDGSARAELRAPELAIPEAALADEAHPYWASDAARAVLDGLAGALARLAPAGFVFACEGDGDPLRLGFFR